MKKLISLVLFIPALLGSCSNDDDDNKMKVDPTQLVSPELDMARIGAQNPFSGILYVTPAQGEGSIYFGNYSTAGNRTSLPGVYILNQGAISSTNTPVRLPTGNYTFVYWGIPRNSSVDSTYSHVAVDEPGYIMGTDMKNMYYKLRPYRMGGDTTYYPVFDYVYSTQPMRVGTDKMSATLERVTAGFKIILTDKNGKPLDEHISSVRVLIGTIASALDYYTGQPSDFSKTVSFPLTKSADSMQMSTNSTVMVFPSAPNPPITLVLALNNGSQKIYKQTLTNTLVAGTRLTLTASVGEIYVEETESNGFEITNWREETETIHFPDN